MTEEEIMAERLTKVGSIEPCPLCGHDRWLEHRRQQIEPIRQYWEMFGFHLDEEYGPLPEALVERRCLHCGLHFFSPRMIGPAGLEMAALGKRVITAGSGHYSNRSFTTTPRTIAEYEEMILNIEKLPPANDDERRRALRYAYWLLWKKPFNFGTFSIEYSSDRNVFHPLNGRPKFMETNADKFFENKAAKYWTAWVTADVESDCILDQGPVSSEGPAPPARPLAGHLGVQIG